MMIQFINKETGGIMWVHESRVEEYKAAGHRPAADVSMKKPPTAKRQKKSTQK